MKKLILLAAIAGACAVLPQTVGGCKLLQSDPALVTDVSNLARCVQAEVVGGDTNMLTIAAKCFNNELQLAYDFVLGLIGLPSFVAAVPADKLAALKASHTSLGADLKFAAEKGKK